MHNSTLPVTAGVLLMKPFLFIVLVVLLGCGRPVPTAPPASTALPLAESDIADRLFSGTDAVTLLSHDGVWRGTDNDLELVLRADGTALITDYGYAISKQTAKYELTSSGVLTVIPDGETPWLPMQTTMDDGMILVSRPDRSDAESSAADAGLDPEQVTDDLMSEAFDQWPLRQVAKE